MRMSRSSQASASSRALAAGSAVTLKAPRAFLRSASATTSATSSSQTSGIGAPTSTMARRASMAPCACTVGAPTTIDGRSRAMATSGCCGSNSSSHASTSNFAAA